MNYWKKSGSLLIATGIFHNLIGVMMGWEVLKELVNAGIINSINTEMDRNAIFWFLFSGFMMMMLGQLMHRYSQEQNKPVPASLGYSLLIITLIGCIMMPVSGFWLVLPQALIILIANKKHNGTKVKGLALNKI